MTVGVIEARQDQSAIRVQYLPRSGWFPHPHSGDHTVSDGDPVGLGEALVHRGDRATGDHQVVHHHNALTLDLDCSFTKHERVRWVGGAFAPEKYS